MAVLTDLRYSVRSLTRTPGVALALVLTIALGIGSNASVFGFIRGSITLNLPLQGIESVVSLFERGAQDAFSPVSFERYLSLKTKTGVFESIGAATAVVLMAVFVAYQRWRFTILELAGPNEEHQETDHRKL